MKPFLIKNKYSKKATTPPPLPPSVKNDERLKQEKALEKLEKEIKISS